LLTNLNPHRGSASILRRIEFAATDAHPRPRERR
jgi:hypothetical protein